MTQPSVPQPEHAGKSNYPLTTGPGPIAGTFRCPSCGNSLQNESPCDAPHLLRCATCKTIFEPAGKTPASDSGVESKTCPQCTGSGENSHGTTCVACNGTGSHIPRDDMGNPSPPPAGKTLGQVAYEAFGANKPPGYFLQWDDLMSEAQSRWEAAAQAVRAGMGDEHQQLEAINALAREFGFGQGELDDGLAGCLRKVIGALRQRAEAAERREKPELPTFDLDIKYEKDIAVEIGLVEMPNGDWVKVEDALAIANRLKIASIDLATTSEQLAAVERERDELRKGCLDTLRASIADDFSHNSDAFADKSPDELVDLLLTATVAVPTSYFALFGAISQRLRQLAAANARAEEAEQRYNELVQRFEAQSCPLCGRHRPFCDCTDVERRENWQFRQQLAAAQQQVEALRKAITEKPCDGMGAVVQVIKMISECEKWVGIDPEWAKAILPRLQAALAASPPAASQDVESPWRDKLNSLLSDVPAGKLLLQAACEELERLREEIEAHHNSLWERGERDHA